MSLTQLRSRGILDGTISAGDLASGVGGKVLQVVTVNDNTLYAAAADGIEYTQLQLSITPSSASSKILVSVNLGLLSANLSADLGVIVKRTIGGSTTNLQVGSSGAACTFVAGMSFLGDPNALNSSHTLIDSPNTTSSCTYEIFLDINSPRTIYINRRGADASFTSSSALHLMEIGA